jgi:hypothetical protein
MLELLTTTVTSSSSPFRVPLAGVRLSQSASSLTDQPTLEPPSQFHVNRSGLDGSWPWTALKLKLGGL